MSQGCHGAVTYTVTHTIYIYSYYYVLFLRRLLGPFRLVDGGNWVSGTGHPPCVLGALLAVVLRLWGAAGGTVSFLSHILRCGSWKNAYSPVFIGLRLCDRACHTNQKCPILYWFIPCDSPPVAVTHTPTVPMRFTLFPHQSASISHFAVCKMRVKER